MLKIDKYKIIRWIGSRAGSDRLLTIAIIVAWIILMFVGLTIRAHAHGIHLSDMQDQFGPIVMGPSWVEDVGMVVCTEGDSEVKCFRLYKHTDLTHSEIHVAPLTEDQAKQLIMLQLLINTRKGR